MTRLKEVRKSPRKERKKGGHGARRTEGPRFTIGDTLSEGRGKKEVRGVEPSVMERRGRSKVNAMGYFDSKHGMEGHGPEKLVSPEANDL